MFWNVFRMVLSGWFLLGFIGLGLTLGYDHYGEGSTLTDTLYKLLIYACCFLLGPFILKECFRDNPWFKYGLRFW